MAFTLHESCIHYTLKGAIDEFRSVKTKEIS